jgi:predicted SAM-dependent methyltransferase/tetratricopeptide (TPR) repeat protein
MVDREIKLNLGCGAAYKPGYVNIDWYDSSVADTICDVGRLPVKPSSVDLIEASQVVEHFDYVHCKYLLSEWFSVLRPKGALILETPDLEKTSKKLISSDFETQQTTLQWAYGIDSQGMQHKTGFTFSLLRSLLKEIGFEGVSREKPRTHLYEHGIRTICRKPESCLEEQLFACFRKRLRGKLEVDDSYVLIPLEGWLRKMFATYAEFKENKEACINQIISKTAMCHPYVPLAFLEECMAFGLVQESEMGARIDLLKWLAEMQFHKKVFSLWMKSKKSIDRPKEESTSFTARLESSVLGILSGCAEYKGSLEYIVSLEPADIEIFDFHLVSLEARKSFNQGVRYFHRGESPEALDCFLKSSRMNPAYSLCYWNMARLGCILKLEEYEIIGNHEKALKLAKSRKGKRSLETELKYVQDGKSHLVPKEPVSEDWQVI